MSADAEVLDEEYVGDKYIQARINRAGLNKEFRKIFKRLNKENPLVGYEGNYAMAWLNIKAKVVKWETENNAPIIEEAIESAKEAAALKQKEMFSQPKIDAAKIEAQPSKIEAQPEPAPEIKRDKPLCQADYAWIMANLNNNPTPEDAPNAAAWNLLQRCGDTMVLRDVLKHATETERKSDDPDRIPIGKSGIATLLKEEFGEFVCEVENAIGRRLSHIF